jgi:hypothetical protein
VARKRVGKLAVRGRPYPATVLSGSPSWSDSTYGAPVPTHSAGIV